MASLFTAVHVSVRASVRRDLRALVETSASPSSFRCKFFVANSELRRSRVQRQPFSILTDGTGPPVLRHVDPFPHRGHRHLGGVRTTPRASQIKCLAGKAGINDVGVPKQNTTTHTEHPKQRAAPHRARSHQHLVNGRAKSGQAFVERPDRRPPTHSLGQLLVVLVAGWRFSTP